MINYKMKGLVSKWVALVVLSTFLFSPGCVTVDDDEGPQEVVVNQIKPNGNDFIDDEITGSAEAKNSRFRFLIGSPDNNFLFAGSWKSENSIGKIDRSGNLIWRTETTFNPNALQMLPDGEHIIAVGALDSDDDGALDKGGLMIVNLDGDVKQQMEIELPSDELWFNGVDSWLKDDKINIAIAGAVRRNEIFFPYLKKLEIDDIDVQIDVAEFDDYTIFESKSLAIMLNIKHALEGSTDNFYCTLNYFNSDGVPFRMEVLKLTNTFDNEDWAADLISSDGTKLFGDARENILISGGNIYVFASQEDVAQGPGINFLAGVITSFDKNSGTLRWGHKIDLSEFSDRIEAMQIVDDEIFLSGQFASFNSNARSFGYGFLAKAPLSTGVVESLLSFGSDAVSSNLGSLRVEGENIYGAGITNLSSGTTFDYWIVKVKKDDL